MWSLYILYRRNSGTSLHRIASHSLHTTHSINRKQIAKVEEKCEVEEKGLVGACSGAL